MAIPRIFQLPRQTAFDVGVVASGAKAYFFKAGTTTPQATYTTSALTTQHAHPVVADSAGLFPVIYLDDDLQYRVQVKDASEVLIYDQDDINDPNNRAPYYPQTTAESSAGVTPTNYQYEPGDIRRYGGSVGSSASDNDTALANALLSSVIVRLPFEGDGRYDVTSSFTLGLRGQQLIGVGTGNHTTASEGVVLNVVSGFPTAGGDAAQAVLNITDRFQSVQNLGIRGNSIALHGIYGTGGNITRCYFKQIVISETTGSAYLFEDSTFMNTFELCEAPSPGTYGFEFDAAGGGSGHTTITLINCYVTSATTAGFRFDAVTGFSMTCCACDSTDGYGIVVETGSTGTVEGWDQENTWQIIDASENASLPCRVSFYGGRFLNLGDASSPARLIYNGGTLAFENCTLQSVGTATAFLEQTSGGEIRWFGNTLELRSQTNTINQSSVVYSDNWVHQSNNSASSERMILEAVSTPRITLFESGGSTGAQLSVDGGVLKIQRINTSTFGVNGTNLEYDTSDGQLSIAGLDDYADDSAASAGGVPVNGLYRNGSVVQVRVS